MITISISGTVHLAPRMLMDHDLRHSVKLEFPFISNGIADAPYKPFHTLNHQYSAADHASYHNSCHSSIWNRQEQNDINSVGNQFWIFCSKANMLWNHSPLYACVFEASLKKVLEMILSFNCTSRKSGWYHGSLSIYSVTAQITKLLICIAHPPNGQWICRNQFYLYIIKWT